MKKRNLISSSLMLPIFALSLVGCGNEKGNTNAGLDKQLYANLNKGFKADGILNITTKFYDDEEHVIESSKVETRLEKIGVNLTYTNSDVFTGYDYKLSYITPENEWVLIGGDNMYDNDGYLFFYGLGYNNKVEPNLSASDPYGNPVPYAGNASLNPFSLVKSYDFDKKDNTYFLNSVQSDVFFSDLLYNMEFVPLNLSVENLSFIVNESNELTNITAKTRQTYGTETFGFENLYTATSYDFDFKVSEIGTAKSADQIQPQPVKEENKPLRTAMDNFDKVTSMLVSRHFKTPLNPAEETVDLYISGEEKAVYMQVYDSHLTTRPTQAGPADALLIDSSKDYDKYLDAYMLQTSLNDETKQVFRKSKDLVEIDNVFTFYELFLPLHNDVSEDIFNINEDGSYSPINEHLPFIASDMFVPFLNTTNEIAGGYVEDVKIYLTFDKSNLDRVEIDTALGDIVGHVTVRYEQLNNCKIPFNAINNIEE